MNTLTNYFIPASEDTHTGGLYEVIENEVLKSCNLKDLNVSGSLFSLTTFVGVTFQSCVFFGTKLENCRFVNCKFIDCDFQFTGIAHCNFKETSFENCKWDVTTIKKSVFSACEVDTRTANAISKEENKVLNLNNTDSTELTWASVLSQGNESEATQTMMLKKAA